MPFSPSEVSELQGIIDSYLAGKKRRIPELPKYETYGDLSLLDRWAVWMNSVDKTVWADGITLKALLTTGGTGTIAPAIRGPHFIHKVTSAEAGGNTVVIPELAGKTFFLRLEGRPVEPTDFNILGAGGFKMNDVDGSPYQLQEGQLFDGEIYELVDVPTGGPASLSSSFISGIVEISSSTVLNGVNHANKLISIRSASAKIAITLPDISTVPANAIIDFEAQINNTYQTKLQTSGGQFIYMNNTSRTSLWIGKGECLSVIRKDDGWVVLDGGFGQNYKLIAKPFPAYSYEDDDNEFLGDGSDILKADYPRIWEKVQTLGGALTNDPVVYAANKGMWLDKDADTLTLPDLQGMFLRGIQGSETAGRFQDEAVNINPGVRGVENTGSGTIAGSVDSINPGGGEFDLTHNYAISDKQGTETRPVNTGVMWVIKY